MTSPVIVSVDPGKESGIVVYYPQEDEVSGSYEEDQWGTVDLVEDVLIRHTRATLVVERFVNTPGPNDPGPWSLEIIGICRHLSRRYGARLNVNQGPSEAWGLASNRVLRSMGWWHRGGAGHANMAFRHLVLYCTVNRIFTTDRVRFIMDSGTEGA